MLISPNFFLGQALTPAWRHQPLRLARYKGCRQTAHGHARRWNLAWRKSHTVFVIMVWIN